MGRGKQGGDVPVAGLGVFVAAFELFFRTFVNTLYYGGMIVRDLLFSPLGFMLLGFVLLSVSTTLLPSIVTRVGNGLLSGWVTLGTQRVFWADMLDLLIRPLPILICLWNLYFHMTANFIGAFVSVALDCVDFAFLKSLLSVLASLLLSTAGSVVGILENPLNGTIPFYVEPVWTNQTLWSIFQNLTDHVEIVADCECHEVQPVTSFILARLRSDNLGQAIDLALNAAIAVPQALFPVLTSLDRPNFDIALDRASAAVIAVGAWIDEWLTEILNAIINPDPNINIGLGCVAARVVCIAIEVVKLFLRFAIAIISGDNVFTTFQTIHFEGVVKRIDDAADCIDIALTQIDSCLGDAVGDIVRFVGDVLEFATKVVQQFQFDWTILFNGFFRIIGNQSYDILGQGSHIIACDGGDCTTHAPEHDQTGLTCLVAKIFGNGDCARAFADLASAGAQVFTLPLFIAEEFLTTDYTSFLFGDVNPLSDAYRDDFNDLLLDIISVVTDRLLLFFDYFSHLIACIPGLENLGDAFVRLVAVIDNIIDDIKTIALLLVELVVQAVLWIFALFGVSPFANSDAGDELLTFFSLFLDALIQLFDLIVDMLTGFLDYFIFSWFPALFGQGTMLSDNPGTARFTQCFTEMDDCICGITKNIANDICLPAGVGCLSDLWPDCGDFEPPTSRRRSTNPEDWYTLNEEDGNYVPNMSIYEYWATEFNGTFCGDVFQRWADDPPQKDQSIGDSDGQEFLNCVNMIHASLQATDRYDNQSSDKFVHPDKLRDLGHAGAKGYAALGVVSLSNAILMFSDPAEVSGLPESEVVYYDVEEGLEQRGISDTMVRNSVMYTYTALYNTTRFFRGLRNDAFRESRQNPGRVSPWHESVKLVDAAWRLGSHSIATASVFGSHFTQASLREKFTAGAWELGAWIMDGPAPDEARQAAKRALEPPAWAELSPQAMVEWRLSQGLWPKEITPLDAFAYKWRKIADVSWQSWLHLTGQPTLMPRANMLGEIQDHIPDSCVALLTGCPTPTPLACNATPGGAFRCPIAPCTGDTFYIPPFRMCNDFYGSALVAGRCNSTFGQTIDFYATVEQCEDGFPRTAQLTAISLLGPQMTCYDTGNPDLGAICIHPDGCTACPVESVLPNFDCALLDEFVHRVEYEFGLCYNLLGIGPPLPQFPINLTTWDSFTPPVQENRTVFIGVCGNGVVERNYTHSYRNPSSDRLTILVGEECDPPGSVQELNISGVFRNYTCGALCHWERCGNAIIDPGEQCDDHNLINGDHCSSLCQLESCGNGVLDFGEQCDDGNIANYDGCSAVCHTEKCGQAYYFEDPTQTTITAIGAASCQSPNTVSLRPDACFSDGIHSFEFNCHSKDPIIWTYSDANCFSRQTTNKVTSDCIAFGSTTNTFCGNPDFAGLGACIGSYIQASASTVCATDCPVCGNGILEIGEECDDGTFYATGNSTEDACVHCDLTCTCASDPAIPCSGTCGNQAAYGLECDPRGNHVTQCGAGGICNAYSCCGDGMVQDPEESCDPGPAGIYNTSNCYLCQPSDCSCQPDKPCLGRCFAYGEAVIAIYPTFPTGSTTDYIYCDVYDNPFACPMPTQTCIPWSCCGDNITQDWEEPSADGGCEPVNSPPGCPVENCSYYDIDGNLNAPRPVQSSRDSCAVQSGEVALGFCASASGATLPYICDRQDPDSCVNNGAPSGSLCRATSCCGDGVNSGIEKLFGSSNDPCEKTLTIPCSTKTDCNYENYYFPYAECSCSSNLSLPCMGRCQVFRTDYSASILEQQGRPCDPRNSSNSPWCSVDLNGIACVPIACCGDSIVQSSSGFTGTIDTLISPMESYDNGTGNCGTQQNILPLLYTRCQCQYNYSCYGLCVDADTGVSSGDPCDDSTAFCSGSEQCWFQACCGDAILQEPYESSEGVDNQCGLPYPPITAKRRRSVVELPVAEPQRRKLDRRAEHTHYFSKLVRSKRSVQLVEFEASGLPQFHEGSFNISGWLDGIFEDIVDWVFVEVFDSSLNATLEPWVQRLSSEEIDPYTPEEERGALYYLVNVFFCTVPLRTNSEEGIGGWATVWILLRAYFFVGLFIAFALFYCSSVFNSLLFMALMYVTPFLFLYIAYGYMFPRCLPMIPLGVVDDIQAVADFLRRDCPFRIDLLNGTLACMPTVPDCAAAGFETGSDTLFYWLELHYPNVTDYLRGNTVQDQNFFVQLLDALFLRPLLHFVSIDDKLAKFNFTASGSGPTPEQAWCFTWTWPMIFQVFAPLAVLLTFLLPLLLIAVLLLIDLLRLANSLVVFGIAVSESMDDRRAYEIID